MLCVAKSARDCKIQSLLNNFGPSKFILSDDPYLIQTSTKNDKNTQSNPGSQSALSAYECEEGAIAVDAFAQPLGEPMDLMIALQLVLRKSLAHGGLSKGLHEGAKVIEKHAAQLCVLAEDCNQPDYVKLVKGLCADHGVVPSN